MVRRQVKQHVKRCRYVGQLSRIQSEAADKSRINVRLYIVETMTVTHLMAGLRFVVV